MIPYPRPRANSCLGCEFFELDASENNLAAHDDDKKGYCFRHAPRPALLHERSKIQVLLDFHWEKFPGGTQTISPSKGGAMAESDDILEVEWPVVRSTDWCGEFTSRQIKA